MTRVTPKTSPSTRPFKLAEVESALRTAAWRRGVEVIDLPYGQAAEEGGSASL